MVVLSEGLDFNLCVVPFLNICVLIYLRIEDGGWSEIIGVWSEVPY